MALNSKVLIHNPYTTIWSQLAGISPTEEDTMSLAHFEKEVPLILRDPSALLIQLFFALPLNVDKAYFATVTQVLYNLSVIQTLAQISCYLSDEERTAWKLIAQKSPNEIMHSVNLIGYIIDLLEQSSLYMISDEPKLQLVNI